MFITKSEDKDEDTSDKTSDKSPDNDKQEDEEEDSEAKSNDKGDKEPDASDAEDLLVKYSKDPASIPKELRGTVKKLLGSYTRGMQRVSLSSKKAEAFDALVTDPEFVRWAEARQNKITGNGKKSSSSTEEEDEDDEKPLTRKQLRAEMEKLTSSRKAEETDNQVKAAFNQFKKDYPDWEIYREDLVAVMKKHPTMDFEEAYKYINPDSRTSSKKEEIESKKNANVNKPNRTSGREGEKKKGKMTVNEAFQMAKKHWGVK